MRALLTGGIKAILAIAALSTAAHWALRVQRDVPASVSVPASALASLPEPTTTGSIEPRRIDRAASAAPAAAALDQSHLAALVAGAAPSKPKAAKAPTRPAVKAAEPGTAVKAAGAKAVVRTAEAKTPEAKTPEAKTPEAKGSAKAAAAERAVAAEKAASRR